MIFKNRSMLFIFSLNILFGICLSKCSEVNLEDDGRSIIHLVSYGMFEKGELRVFLSFEFTQNKDGVPVNETIRKFDFTLDRTHQSSAQIAQYEEKTADGNGCNSLEDSSGDVDSKTIAVRFRAEEDYELSLVRGSEMQHVAILPLEQTTKQTSEISHKGNATPNKTTKTNSVNGKEGELSEDGASPGSSQSVAGSSAKEKRDGTPINTDIAVNKSPDNQGENPGKTVADRADIKYKLETLITTFKPGQQSYRITVGFRVRVVERSDAGLYSLYFHNCHIVSSTVIAIDVLNGTIQGVNTLPRSYLSAGDIPLPFLYFAVCVIYLLLSFVWTRVLRNASSAVLKTHYLMLAVCVCKSVSALFHGMNYYYIGKNGREETAWAVIYYITYLMKTVMLFLTIMLIGSGWSFIKHVFSEKEKKLFLVAIPLQVLLYVGYVIMSETEVASKTYSTWSTLSVIIDLLCCGAILAPVMWSIRHLEEASRTNGKASINLRKLKLFKTLYMMLVAYVYTTRLIILVMKLTLPFSSSYLGEVFTEATVLLFLVTLGYKFRPADDNPYFQIPPDSDDEQDDEVEVVVAQSAVQSEAKKRKKTIEGGEREGLLNSHESSHDLD